MKKQTLLLLAGGMLAMASCQNEAPAVSNGPSEAQIDSMVNARVEAIRTELMAQNDSLINALAQWKADSMIAAMKGTKTAAAKPVSKPKPAEAKLTTTKPATVGNGKPSMTGNTAPGTVGNGKPSMTTEKKDGTVGNGKPSMK
ncbi:MAG: hypothetical protein JNK00_11470 [Flavipsychrobacter sp.]|nr:hypothetical protein [Flavipsychrobacter sp.]